jgi:hypothetical protein
LFEAFFQRFASGKITAHAMHTAARRRRRRTNIQVGRWSFLDGWRRPQEQLLQRRRAAIDIAADEVALRRVNSIGGATSRANMILRNPGAERSI